MLLTDDYVVLTPNDLAGCDFAFVRRVAELRGLVDTIDQPVFMEQRVRELTAEQKCRARRRYAKDSDVVELSSDAPSSLFQLYERHKQTMDTLRRARVVVGGGLVAMHDTLGPGVALFSEPPFLIADRRRGITVADVVLERFARAGDLVRLGGHVQGLEWAISGERSKRLQKSAQIHLSNDRTAHHLTSELGVVTRMRLRHLAGLAREATTSSEALPWGRPDINACGFCAHCKAAADEVRDVQLVWGMRRNSRLFLYSSGIFTIDELAASTTAPPTLDSFWWKRFRDRARLQLRQEESTRAGNTEVSAAVHNVAVLHELPKPSPGDLFFDFEGDPFWVEKNRWEWGLEYLFGAIEADTDEYVTFWAANQAEERVAFEGFLKYVRRRRKAHPGMHIYHFAFYEPATMRRLARRHRVGGDEVAELIDAGVFVDLYEVVKAGVNVSQRSYGLKALEPLYMGDDLRDSDVTDGGDAVVAYQTAVSAQKRGDREAAEAILTDLADYNRYDCESTRRLRDWLIAQRDQDDAQAHDRHVEVAVESLGGQVLDGDAGISKSTDTSAAQTKSVNPLHLVAGADVGARAHRIIEKLPRGEVGQTYAAALMHHQREAEALWAAHNRRLAGAIELDEPGLFDVRSHSVTEPWQQTSGSARHRRRVEIHGRSGSGSRFLPGDEMFVIYGGALPAETRLQPGQAQVAVNVQVVDYRFGTGSRETLVFEEIERTDLRTHDLEPRLITPGVASTADEIVLAIADAAEGFIESAAVSDATGMLSPAHALLTRTDLGTPQSSSPDRGIRAELVAQVRQKACTAVQGSPGSGKTELGAQVIAELANAGWRIGVVASAPVAVRNMLRAVASAGVPTENVGISANIVSPNRQSSGASPAPWRVLDQYDVRTFLSESGVVLGGTAAEVANRHLVGAAELDLLVIDEAGQFSLAETIAASTSASRLLLIGDPQQLPLKPHATHRNGTPGAQVSDSAFAWLLPRSRYSTEQVLPADRGFYLETTHRLHPALCTAIAKYSYSGRIVAAPQTSKRSLAGIQPGVHAISVPHYGNTTHSLQEAQQVRRLIEELVGRSWHPDPLTAADIVVVGAYQAQVHLLREALDEWPGVRVGVVEEFQGQEAVISIISLAASTLLDAPRGPGFVLSKQWLNVALSRAQWASFLVYSEHLMDQPPPSTRVFSDAAGFSTLVENSSSSSLTSQVL